MKPVKLIVRAFGPYAGEQIFDFAALAGRSFFLIHGPTGAGKTSILDAICFALYGQTSGDREARQMRSDHARPETVTEVTFDFSIGAERYRIRRQPEQERPRKKGTGTVSEKPSATLWIRPDPDDGDGTIVEDGWAKVNDRIERLLGFKVDQFRQVVLLPQGMFQRLLLASSKDREEILEALFAVESYGRIEAALKESALQMKRDRETATQHIAATLQAAGMESKEQLISRRAELEGQHAAGIIEREALRLTQKSAAEAVAAARQTADRIAERDQAAQSLRALEAQREAFVLKQGQHERACKAGALVQREEELLRRQAEAKAAAAKLAEAKKFAELAEAARQQAAAALEAQTALEPQREAARARVLRLEALADQSAALTSAATAVKTAEAQAAEAIAARTKAEKSANTAKNAKQSAETRVNELEKAYARLPLIEAQLKHAVGELNTRKSLEVQRTARAASITRIERLQVDLPKAEQSLKWTRETLEDLQNRWNRGQAALLARSLTPDEPCPVCGSPHHPHPAQAAADLPSEEKLKGARERVDLLTGEFAKVSAKLAKHEAELAGIDAQMAQLQESLGMRIAADVEALQRELAEIELQRQLAESAGLELDRARRSMETGRAQETAAAAGLAQAESAVVAATGALGAAQGVLNERLTAVPEELRGTGALERERTAAGQRRKTLDDALAAAQKDAEAKSNELAKARAARAAAGELAEATAALFEFLRKEFGERAREAGFEDHAAFKAARLSNEQIAGLDAEIRGYHVAMEAARARLERASTAAAGLTMPDLPAMIAADAAAQRALEVKADQLAQLAQQSAAGTAALARLAEIEIGMSELDERYKVLGAIADAANGQNPYRMTFQRYLLGVFLDEVLYAATQRLRTMSKGRFLLQRVTDAGSGNAQRGLDLQVHDTHTSTVRPVSTLSGGESFLASLSLALGLADVVQSYAGGIRLETIFVDEGFGTLDPESLDLAVRALMDLQKGGRLVGIISHVSELKERIDARLEVTAGRAGSVARFVVG